MGERCIDSLPGWAFPSLRNVRGGLLRGPLPFRLPESGIEE
jgi:hypothetical protein